LLFASCYVFCWTRDEIQDTLQDTIDRELDAVHIYPSKATA